MTVVMLQFVIQTHLAFGLDISFTNFWRLGEVALT